MDSHLVLSFYVVSHAVRLWSEIFVNAHFGTQKAHNEKDPLHHAARTPHIMQKTGK